MTYYEAKFLREKKANPMDWIIIPIGYGRVRLVCLKGEAGGE